MLGAYMAFTLASLTGSLAVAMVLGVVLSVVVGLFMEWALFSHLYKRDHLEQVLLTYGLILIFEELRSIIVGNDVHGVTVPPVFGGSIALGDTMTYPVYRLVMSAVCLAIAGGMYLLIQRTRLGMMIRAGASNREMVGVLGVNVNLVFRLVFALGRDRYLPRVLGTVSAKHRVPLAALAVNTVLEWALAIGGSFDALALISGGAICLVYVLVSVAAWRAQALDLRERGERPFRLPGGASIPLVAVAAMVAIITTLKAAEWTAIGIALAVLVVVYVSLRLRRTALELR